MSRIGQAFRMTGYLALGMSWGSAVASEAPFGWSCSGTEGENITLQADVLRTEAIAESDEYLHQLRVAAYETTGTVLYPLLRLQGVACDEERDRYVYRGENGVAKAELSIRPIDGELRAPGQLRLSRSSRLPEDPLPANSETDMVCTPIR
jgi:hypothetical protein